MAPVRAEWTHVSNKVESRTPVDYNSSKQYVVSGFPRIRRGGENKSLEGGKKITTVEKETAARAA